MAGGVVILTYVVYEYFCQKEQFENTPVKEEFYKMYHQAKRDKLKRYSNK